MIPWIEHMFSWSFCTWDICKFHSFLYCRFICHLAWGGHLLGSNAHSHSSSPPSVLIWLKYCWKGYKISSSIHRSIHHSIKYRTFVNPPPRPAKEKGGRGMRWYCGNFQCRGVILIWIIGGHVSTALAGGAEGRCLDIFSLVYPFSLSLEDGPI